MLDGEMIGRVAAAVALGAVVGLEREVDSQPAGLRTHISVCLGACLFGIVSTLGFEEFVAERATTNYQVDVTRVASQVVVGVGFLGAGMIFRRELTVANLTTAATVWVVAAIGLAAGVGDPQVAVAGTVALVAALVALRLPRRWIRRRVRLDKRRVRIVLVSGDRVDGVLATLRSFDGVGVEELSVGKEAGCLVVSCALEARAPVDLDARIGDLARRDDIVTLRSSG